MSEAGEGRRRRRVGGEWWDLYGVRCTEGEWGVTHGVDHAFLSEEAVQRVTEGGEERWVQGPVAELRLPHALQQVWVTREVYVCPV